MNQIYEKLLNCSNAVKSKVKFQPEVALILGSGLGDYAKEMQVEESFRICRRGPGSGNAGKSTFL